MVEDQNYKPKRQVSKKEEQELREKELAALRKANYDERMALKAKV